MRTVGIYTLGCKVNTYESEYIINKLQENGYIIKDFDDICDIYIINTCTVTNSSDNKSKKMIRTAINKNKNACIVVMGCFIAANMDYEEEGIDIVIANKDKSKIIDLLSEYYEKKEKVSRTYKERLTEFEDMYITNFPGRTRAFVKIQDGCDNFCSYCIIPFVRGKCRSKKEEKVISEVTSLVENNYKEIVLTGIHTGNYGTDINTNLASLLRKLVQIKGLYRIRISSIEVTELNNEILDILKDEKIIANHLHIPLQSGTDEILKSMNRKYDTKFFKEKIDEIRKIRPNIAISTDVIVGFPGETDELFNKTLDYCKDIAFSKIHVFPYSERKNTKAAAMDNKVDNKEKKVRAKRLIELSKELEINYMNKFIGEKVEVLIEESRKDESSGHTSNYLHVKTNKKIENNKIESLQIERIEYPYVIAK